MAADWLKLVVAAAVGGVAGGGVVYAATRDARADVTATAETPPAEASDSPDEALNERMRALEDRVHRLQKQLATRSNLGNYAKKLAGDAGTTDGAGADAPADAEDPRFELAVRSVVDRIQYERDEQRRDERVQRREQRVTGQVEYLSEQLNLSDDQLHKVEELLLAQMEAFGEMRDADNRPTSRSEWRERAGAIRQQTRAKLGEVLDDDQLSKYDELQEEERGNRDRARGGRGDRGDR